MFFPNGNAAEHAAVNLARIHDLARQQAHVLRRVAMSDFWYRMTRSRVIGGPVGRHARAHNAGFPRHLSTGV